MDTRSAIKAGQAMADGIMLGLLPDINEALASPGKTLNSRVKMALHSFWAFGPREVDQYDFAVITQQYQDIQEMIL